MDYSKIKFLFLDVDGTLTDGKIYMSDSGELFKAFDVKDGCGIKDILPKLGIKPVIITARSSKILLNRCKELSIDMIFQNTRDKVGKIKEIMNEYGYSLNSEGVYEEAAYMGDDILDIPPMMLCKVRACPDNAVNKVKECCNFISTKNGGDGAVRELIEDMLGYDFG